MLRCLSAMEKNLGRGTWKTVVAGEEIASSNLK